MPASTQLARAFSAVMCLAAMTGRANAWDSPAPDVVLYCTPALQTPLRRVAIQFRAASGVEVHILTGSPDGQAGLIRHRARADVIVAESAIIETLRVEHLVRPESVVALGEDPLVLIASTNTAPPQEAPAAQLLATHVTILTDPTSAASFDGAATLRAAFPAIPFRSMGVADTPTIVALTRADRKYIGLVYRSEVYGAGVAQAAPVPIPPTPFSGALVTNGQSRNAAALLAFVAGTQGRAILQFAGVQVKS